MRVVWEPDRRPLLVGEANPYGGPPGNALVPWPDGCAGWRLCHRVLGLTEEEYMGAFARANLCHRRWSLGEARAEALRLGQGYAGPLVLLGAKVCSAFRVPFEPFNLRFRLGSSPVVILPHPSGLCRLWNAPGAYERARRVVLNRAVFVDAPAPRSGGQRAGCPA